MSWFLIFVNHLNLNSFRFGKCKLVYKFACNIKWGCFQNGIYFIPSITYSTFTLGCKFFVLLHAEAIVQRIFHPSVCIVVKRKCMYLSKVARVYIILCIRLEENYNYSGSVWLKTQRLCSTGSCSKQSSMCTICVHCYCSILRL